MPQDASPRRLLMITHRVPYPPNRGDRIRSWHLLRCLRQHFQVHLACLADEPISFATWQKLKAEVVELAIEPCSAPRRYAQALRSLARGRSLTEGAFYHPELHRTVREWASQHQFDAALGVCSSTAVYLHDLPIGHKVLDLVDTDSRKWRDYADHAAGLSRRLYRLESQRLSRWERTVADAFEAVTLVTPREAELYRQVAPTAHTAVVPNGVDLDYFQPHGPAEQPNIIFTGVMDYRPNVDAVAWLARNVWPQLVGYMPQARFRIVGCRPTPLVRQLAEIDGIEVVADVKDIRPHLRDAAVAVAPLRIARGVQNKVLEAMACALPTVVSPQAAAGVGACDGQEYRVAERPEAWVSALRELLTKQFEARRLGQAGLAYVERTRRWDRCLLPMAKLLQGRGSAPADQHPRETPRDMQSDPFLEAA